MNDNTAEEHAFRFPPMCDSVISRDELQALMSDLKQFTTIEEILLRQQRRGYIDETQQPGIDDVFPLLDGGHVRGVQIRYSWESSCWFDTIMIIEGGFRLIRVRHEFGETT